MNIKKILALPAVFALALSFSACEGDNTVSVKTEPAPDAEHSANPTDSSKNSSPADNQGATVKLLIDDFEDGDAISALGDPWYSSTDAGSGAESTLEPDAKDSEGHPSPTKTDNGSKNALSFKYTLKKGNYDYDAYVGWGVHLPEGENYSKYTGVSYRYKGGDHTIRIETSDVKDYNYHGKRMNSSKEWTTVTLEFSDLAQEEGWGTVVDFDPSHITGFSIQVKGPDGQDALAIDDIYLIGNGSAPANNDASKDEKKPDITPKDPVIPKVTLGDLKIDTDLQKKAMKYLNKGVSFTNWLEENRKFDGTFEVGKKDVKILSDNGFKAIRLPIDLDKYTLNRDEFIADATGKTELKINSDTLFMVLDSFVEWTKEYNMSLTIDYHEYDNSYNATSADNERYRVMMATVWKAVASHYASNAREDIFYELLNEPDMSDGKVTAAQWTKAAQGIIDSIRTVDKTHTLLFGDAQWYSMDLLAKRTPFADKNIIYVIHTYEPFVFTHQGASWSETYNLKNIPFPYDKAKWPEYSTELGLTSTTASWVRSNVMNYYKTGNKESILNAIYKAKAWAVTNQVPIIINEFGAYSLRSTEQDRLNYLTAMREICDTLQVPWTHWGYTGGFEVIRGDKLIEGLDKALGLK